MQDLNYLLTNTTGYELEFKKDVQLKHALNKKLYNTSSSEMTHTKKNLLIESTLTNSKTSSRIIIYIRPASVYFVFFCLFNIRVKYYLEKKHCQVALSCRRVLNFSWVPTK